MPKIGVMKHNWCVACRGSGKSTKQTTCVPCKGTGIRQPPPFDAKAYARAKGREGC